MKIVIPTAHYYPSNIGGTATAVYWFINGLQRYKIVKTFVVTSCLGIDDKTNIHINKLYYYSYGATEYLEIKNPKKSLHFLLSSLKLTNRSDIVYLPSLFFPPTVIILLFAMLRKKKILLSPNGQLFEAALSRKNISKYLYIHFFKVFSKRIYWHATSSVEKENIEKYFQTRQCFILPNYIETAKRLAIKKKKQFLFLGRINPIKGLTPFITALAENNNFRQGEFVFLIAGGAKLAHEMQYKASLEQLIKEKNLESKVSFIGVVEGKTKETYLAESHCLVLPSFSENFGNVVLESLNQHTPALTTTGTPWEILVKKKCGWWVENNVASFNKAVDEVLTQKPAAFQQFCTNATQLVDEDFDIKNNIEHWFDKFTEINNS